MFRIHNSKTDDEHAIVSTIKKIYTSLTYVGEYKFSARNSDYNDWLVCDGRSLSREDYKDLFDVISTSFGSVDEKHFNLPDFRGKVFGPINNQHSLGQNVGSEQVTLTINQIPSHNHTGTTSTDGSHTHTHNANASFPGYGLAYRDGTNTRIDADNKNNDEINLNTAGALVINASGSHSHTFTTNNTGGSQPHSVMQPTLFAGNVFILSKSNFYLLGDYY